MRSLRYSSIPRLSLAAVVVGRHVVKLHVLCRSFNSSSQWSASSSFTLFKHAQFMKHIQDSIEHGRTDNGSAGHESLVKMEMGQQMRMGHLGHGSVP